MARYRFSACTVRASCCYSRRHDSLGEGIRMSWLGLGIVAFVAIVLSEGAGERGWGLGGLAAGIGWLLQRMHRRIGALEAQLQSLRAAPAEAVPEVAPAAAASPVPAIEAEPPAPEPQPPYRAAAEVDERSTSV